MVNTVLVGQCGPRCVSAPTAPMEGLRRHPEAQMLRLGEDVRARPFQTGLDVLGEKYEAPKDQINNMKSQSTGVFHESQISLSPAQSLCAEHLKTPKLKLSEFGVRQGCLI